MSRGTHAGPVSTRTLAVSLAYALSLHLATAVTCRATPAATPELAARLSFEGAREGNAFVGWGGGPKETLFADNTIFHGGQWSARLERNATSANKFSTVTLGLPIDFGGKQLELRGFLKLEGVEGSAGLWLREDGSGQPVAFDNMQDRHLDGTRDWQEFAIVLPLKDEARAIAFGCLLSGTGKVWVDDLQLLVDGAPVWAAPKSARVQTPLDLDHTFDGGSRITAGALTPVQIDNLTTLGKVWGFLKYHHPAVASGTKHWDYELFRVLPDVLASGDRKAANAALLKWIDGLGPIAPCAQCAVLDEHNLALRPELDWIADTERLGPDLSLRLRAIHHDRPTAKQFYVDLQTDSGNPDFTHEPSYAGVKLPDVGYQILGLYRFWNIIALWFPYRDVLAENWDAVLAESLPRVALAKSTEEYQLELMRVIARAHDTHANLWSSLGVRPPVGDCRLPVEPRFIEGQAVVVASIDAAAAQASRLSIGDVIESIDGTPVETLVDRWTPFYATSNDAARARDIARSMTRGDCGDVKLSIRRGAQQMDITAHRVTPPSRQAVHAIVGAHDHAGPAFRLLSPDVAYLKISSLKKADVDADLEAAKGTKALVIDLRNYPSDFPLFDLGNRLVDKDTPFASFTVGDAANPGAFHWGPTESLTPKVPRYAGKVAVLVDEVTQSSAEYHSMAFRAAGAVIVGSTTAGADGDVSPIPLPGGYNSMISGIGVFYPDKRPTQRIGVVPDIEARPTIAGIRAGRDEVLEAALRSVLGAGVPAAEIERLARW